MQKFSVIAAQVYVIDYLSRKRYFGAHQTLSENIPKGTPPEHKKTILKAINKLANKGLLITKKKHYGVHVSLNPRKTQEMREYLQELEDKL